MKETNKQRTERERLAAKAAAKVMIAELVEEYRLLRERAQQRRDRELKQVKADYRQLSRWLWPVTFFVFWPLVAFFLGGLELMLVYGFWVLTIGWITAGYYKTVAYTVAKEKATAEQIAEKVKVLEEQIAEEEMADRMKVLEEQIAGKEMADRE